MQQETSQESWTVFKRLLGYVRDRKLGLVGGIIGMLGYAAVDTTFVYSIKPLIDQGLNGNDSSVLKWMPFFVLGIVALRGCAAFLSNYCMAWVGNHVVMRLQQQVFSHLMAMPMSFFDRQNTGNLLSKVTYDAGQVSSAASSTLVSLVREGATVIGLLGLMFWHSWQLSVIFLVVGPLVGILISIISRRFRKISRHIQQAVGDITTSTEQMLKGHKEVLMFGGQEVEDKRFYQVSNRMRQQTMKMVAADAIGSPIVQMVASVALAVFLYVATIDSVKATLTAGTFTVMVTSMMMLLKPLKSLTDVNNQFQRGITACQSLFGLLDSTPEQDTGTRTLERARGEIEFRNVTFTYPTKETPALRNISFKVEAGKSVALVGRSGSGKSTIASLLTRFYDIEEGEILLDGVNIREYRLSELRKQYALVSQHVHLFNDSVANNIAYAAEEKYSRDEIKQAARIAHADDFVSKMPEGYDTVIGENGASLSGGQRQRIAIARAMILHPALVVLDEPTSALDRTVQQSIVALLKELQAAHGLSYLFISHDLAVVRAMADEIMVMKDGRVVERGPTEAIFEAPQQDYTRRLIAAALKC